jgi:DNA polymerase-3 subunit delta'
MREGLCYRLSLKPTRGGRKIAIIDDADHLNVEGANCLLKTLEEPPPRSVLVLNGTNEQRQLPTIRSRAQSVRFSPLSKELVERLLVEKRLVDDPRDARMLAELSGGSLARALVMADTALREFREALFGQLVDLEVNQFAMATAVAAFVTEAGKEGAAKRQRMNQILDFAAEYYRGLMRRLEGIPFDADGALNRALDTGQKRYRQDAEAAAACLERCLDAQLEVDRNANQATLAECWTDDLAMISVRGYAVT